MSLFITHACRSCIVWLESGPCIRALPTLSNVLTLASLNTGICRNMTNRLIIMSGLMRLPRLMFSQAQVNFSFVCALLLKKKHKNKKIKSFEDIGWPTQSSSYKPNVAPYYECHSAPSLPLCNQGEQSKARERLDSQAGLLNWRPAVRIRKF